MNLQSKDQTCCLCCGRIPGEDDSRFFVAFAPADTGFHCEHCRDKVKEMKK